MIPSRFRFIKPTAAGKVKVSAVVMVLLANLLVTPNAARAFKPEDPVVVDMVSRGLRFMEQFKTNDAGEHVLFGYAHFKAEHDATNPVVQRGIREAQSYAASLPRGQQFKSHYHAAVSILLLCEVDPVLYRKELATFQRYFQDTQRPDGSFTYPDEKVGDTSQTQYAILGIWILDRFGFKVDYGRLKKAVDWLMAVQDIRGPWPYHGEVPPNKSLIQQKKTSNSMALAGAASLLIAGDAMKLWGEQSRSSDSGIVGMPKAVKAYQEDLNASRRSRANKVDPKQLFKRIAHMEKWRSTHREERAEKMEWYFYVAYTTERYESFVEIAKGLPSEPSPPWYNHIVGELRQMQATDGGWSDKQTRTNAGVSTAFAILFLIRSTKKSLGAGASATTIGGIGFKGDISKAKLVNGSAKTKTPAQSVTGMLDLLEGDGADQLDGKALSDSAVLPTDPTELAAQLDRLERLVRGSKSWQARRVSAKLLGSSDSFRVVPALIFALSDPDDSVRAYARDGLRFISRNFEGYGMPDEPSNSDIRKAQKAWRTWYKRVRPDYVFLDE